MLAQWVKQNKQVVVITISLFFIYNYIVNSVCLASQDTDSITKPLVSINKLDPTLSYINVKTTDTKRYIPKQAFQYFPVVEKEVIRNIPGFYKDKVHYFTGLIEHESCLSLTHSRCWSPSSRLKTAREEGAGLSQLTRAYREDGTIRFDIITDLKKQHSNELKELSWSNVYQRPDLQIRAMVLLSKNNFNKIPSKYMEPIQHIAFTDAAYNGGLTGVNNSRRACGLAKDCDPDIWFNHVNRHCLKSKKPLYGNRSVCDIWLHHVDDVIHTRMPKYKPYF